eukprot:364705-Chlamydomonas_euryale.AAC.2
MQQRHCQPARLVQVYWGKLRSDRGEILSSKQWVVSPAQMNYALVVCIVIIAQQGKVQIQTHFAWQHVMQCADIRCSFLHQIGAKIVSSKQWVVSPAQMNYALVVCSIITRKNMHMCRMTISCSHTMIASKHE